MRYPFLTHSLNFTAILNTDALFQQVNPTWQQLLGWSDNKLLTKTLFDLVHPEDKTAVLSAWPQWQQQSSAPSAPLKPLQLRLEAADGTYHWLSFKAQADSATSQIYLMAYDITEQMETQQRLREEQARLALLYNVTAYVEDDSDKQLTQALELITNLFQLQFGIISQIHDENYTVRYVYPAGGGIDVGQQFALSTTYCALTMSANRVIDIYDVHDSPHEAHPCYINFGLESYIGSVIWVDGKRYGTLNFSSSAPRSTPFTQADNQLVELLARWVGNTLERQATEAALHEAKERAEAANRAKSTFLANMSHELRTPLAAIIGYNELMQDAAQAAAQIQYDQWLDKSLLAATHLLALIDDVLDISKIEAGHMELRWSLCNWHDLITDIITTATPLTAKNQNNLIVAELPALPDSYVDVAKVRQIILNLLSNAAKFTHEGEVQLQLLYRDEETKQIDIIIQDTGIGMRPNQVNQLFEPFVQVHRSDLHKYGGTGLGLSISYHLAQMLGGKIEVNSKEGAGSTFTLSLPWHMSEPMA